MESDCRYTEESCRNVIVQSKQRQNDEEQTKCLLDDRLEFIHDALDSPPRAIFPPRYGSNGSRNKLHTKEIGFGSLRLIYWSHFAWTNRSHRYDSIMIKRMKTDACQTEDDLSHRKHIDVQWSLTVQIEWTGNKIVLHAHDQILEENVKMSDENLNFPTSKRVWNVIFP